MQVLQKLLHLIHWRQPRIEPDRRDAMPAEVRIDAFLDDGGAGACRDDGLHRAGCIARLLVALKQEARVTPLEMCAEFARQCRSNRHVAIRPPFGVASRA
jgi:hypothetical protein